MENSIDDKLKTHLDWYQGFIDATDDGHREAKTRRQYVNNKQWTQEEIEVLRRRKQAVITDNQIKRKTDYFLGIERQTRTDPKAFPRTPEHEQAADAITDALRYVCDNSDWDIERSEGFDYLIVEGIEAYIVPVEKTPKGIEVMPRHIPWDRVIYDPHSRDRFFRDAKYKGVVTWMDKQDAKDMFPDKEDVIDQSFSNDESTVFDDRPNPAIWTDRAADRVKIIQMYYLEKGVWQHCVFTEGGYLIEPDVSTYQDEYGRPDCPIEMAGAYIDQDNDRFGLVDDMMSLQDMVNKMESKYMHFINSNQTWGNKKAGDPNKLKVEARKPDGHFSMESDAVYGQDFGVVPTDNKAMQSFNLLQQAMSSLNEIGGNSIVSDSASGRSKEVTAQTKNIELGAVLDTHRQCSKRVYRQIYNRVKQFWREEKWVRVTDDEDNLKFVMLNQPKTYAQLLEEKFGEQWKSQVPMNLAPYLNQVAKIENNVAEIDVDIILEDAPDIINIQQEQFALIARLAESYGPEHVPFEEVLKLSSLRNKDAFIERTKGNEQQRQQNEQMMQQKREQAEQMQMQGYMVELQEKASRAKLNEAKAAESMTKAQKNMAEEEKIDLEAENQEIENELTVNAVSA